MDYSKQVWDQLKNLTADQIVKALRKKGWTKEEGSGAIHVYVGPNRKRVGVHYHPQKTYGPKLLKALLDDIGWSLSEMKELKLISLRPETPNP